MFSKTGAKGGLVIVKRIVEKHGGKIWVESVVNEGLTFYFTLSPGINGSAFQHMSKAA
jgi:signal transduction histidine kinase